MATAKNSTFNASEIFEYLIIGTLLYLFVKVMWPFVASAVFAVFFAIVFFPLFSWLKKKIGSNWAAILVVMLTMLIIFVPLGIFLGLVAAEAVEFVRTFSTDSALAFMKNIENYSLFGYSIEISEIQAELQNALKTAGTTIYETAKTAGSQALAITFSFFVFVFLYFYFLRDGEDLMKKAHLVLPFSKKQNLKLMKELNGVTKAVFIGNLLGAILAGIVAYIGFEFFGLPGALIWGMLAGLLSLIPSIGAMLVYIIGAGLVWVLSGIYLALGFVAYYLVGQLLLVENLIIPKFLDEKISVHPVLVFFALVGGVEVFGSAGIVYGPLIVVLFVTMVDFVLIEKK